MTATTCERDGCGGTIVDGYCDVCGMAAKRAPATPATPVAPAAPTGFPAPASAAIVTTRSNVTPSTITGTTISGVTSTRTGTATGSSTARAGIGRGLVTIPDVVTGDPQEALIVDPSVPEKDRFCASCGAAVGRSRDGSPGRVTGFCPSCRHPFDFAPKLTAGEVVAGQYEVAGCLAHGGLGWIHLAKDRNVSNRWVVLKGVLDAGSADARAAALAERQFLAAMEHGEIVKIYNFVVHRGAEYIVMEYVAGKSLKSILKERRAANGGAADPLPPDQAIAYILGVLPAFAYLHDHGFVYCDFKPDNVIHRGDHLKLIDLGGVRRLDDPAGNIYGTVGFQAPEVAQLGPSIASDIYTIGRTLAVLTLDFRGYTTDLQHSLPSPADHPLLVEFDSLLRVIARATATDPAARFADVDELGVQLMGVLREVVALRTGTPRPAASTVFTGDLLASMGSDLAESPDERYLPTPYVVLDDPAAAFLANLNAPEEQIPAIIESARASGQVPDSVEARLRVVRAHIATRDAAAAEHALGRVVEIAGTDWRVRWYEGIVALAAGRSALAPLEAVRSWLPGEIAPMLALGLALEREGDHRTAAALYERALAIDPSYSFAAFRLGSCLLAMGDRARAVAALDRVPPTSVLHDDAGVASVAALLGADDAAPTPADLTAASAIVDRLAIDARRRAVLARDVLTRALQLDGGATLFGEALDDTGVRARLEQVCRELAAGEQDRTERVRLVDEANRVRPRTWW